ncbi:MAG: hypothetical protein EOP86_24120 [Verrucomicrobiaceae bacterium]|nr:MAG: hypothetical protein EOP86_24120 [Verrucomicrobiaceae bacterium]
MRARKVISVSAAGVILILLVGSWRDVDFWSTPDQRGDALMEQRRYADAARVYLDPLRRGIALYREGDFKDAVAEFEKVPGATGAYNAGNANVMQGRYDAAIANYDRALGFRHGWKEAEENKQLAIARRDAMTLSDEDREEEATEAYDPDKIVQDLKGQDKSKEQEQKPMTGEVDDAALQATWLRKVRTTPGQFLKAKFAWQVQAESQPPAPAP